ncbi:MAG TPA: hypothetical protein PLI95_13520 [Polyangiaceae bacterium]|nr:hypothetical protein [Polyangiaceae bacterium]
MPTIHEARGRVQHQIQRLLALVDWLSAQTATEVEGSLCTGVLELGAAVMALFFAHQAVRWPQGLRCAQAGVEHQVQGETSVEIGTRFGKVRVVQLTGRVVGRPRDRRDLPMAHAWTARRQKAA